MRATGVFSEEACHFFIGPSIHEQSVLVRGQVGWGSLLSLQQQLHDLFIHVLGISKQLPAFDVIEKRRF